MCTVSIVPNGGGFTVMSNRDERRDRAAALQPNLATIGSHAAIMPIDPVAGGSWIGVNDAGLVAAVLNRHAAPAADTRATVSRGVIVRQVLGCDSITSALQSVATLDPGAFQPFRLVLVQERRIGLFAGDGHQFAGTCSTLERPHMFTASSLGDVFVDPPRRRLFECLMNRPGERRQNQRLFHQHQWIDKREISVLMEREDAATVSRTIIDVRDRGVALEYESLLPQRPVGHVELQLC